MYEAYWQLNQKPFDETVDPRFYYPAESHQASLLKLRYAVENRRGGALLVGQPGVGKTLLATMLPGVLGPQCTPVVRLVFPRMPTADLMAYLADELDCTQQPTVEGEDCPAPSTGSWSAAAVPMHVSVRRIERFLLGNARQGQHAVLVIDESHLLEGPRTFEALRLLLNFQTDGVPTATLLLVGQPAILPVLDRMPQWEERLAVKCLLRPFSEAETAAYIEHRLRVAGAKHSIIDPDALPTLQELTHGIPRRINRLCDLALLVGFAEEQPILRAEHFESVCRELVSVAPE